MEYIPSFNICDPSVRSTNVYRVVRLVSLIKTCLLSLRVSLFIGIRDTESKYLGNMHNHSKNVILAAIETLNIKIESIDGKKDNLTLR